MKSPQLKKKASVDKGSKLHQIRVEDEQNVLKRVSAEGVKEKEEGVEFESSDQYGTLERSNIPTMNNSPAHTQTVSKNQGPVPIFRKINPETMRQLESIQSFKKSEQSRSESPTKH